MHAPAQAAERRLDAQEIGRGSRTKGDDHFRPNHINLLEEKLGTGVGLFGFGRAVLGWPALYDIRDVDLLSFEAGGCDHVVKQLACAADEGESLRILVCSWSLAHEHEPGVRVTVSKHDFVAPGA